MSQTLPFDRTTANAFLVAIRAGASNETAAAHADVTLEAIRSWIDGEDADCVRFRRDVDKARADLRLLAVGSLRRQVGEDNGAARYIAEMTHGDAELERLRRLTT
jgi:hypothetical protein